MVDMKFFKYDHLPESLQNTSKEVHALAHYINLTLPDGAEKSAGMRKLLEAKDCFVRARMAGITK